METFTTRKIDRIEIDGKQRTTENMTEVLKLVVGEMFQKGPKGDVDGIH